MSMKLTPDAATSTRSWPGPGLGAGQSLTCKTSGPPCLSTTTARMVSYSPARTTAGRSGSDCDHTGTDAGPDGRTRGGATRDGTGRQCQRHDRGCAGHDDGDGESARSDHDNDASAVPLGILMHR